MKLAFLLVVFYSFSSYAESLQTKDSLRDEPCGKVVTIKYTPNTVEVILRPVGAKANRGEVFKKPEFDLPLVSQVALKVFEADNLLFCTQLNSANKMEFFISR